MIETLINEGLSGFAAQSAWEWIAATLGVLYVVLAAKESKWCWPAAFVSTLIYTLLFWQGQLPMQSILNFYYLLMALYGWQQWQTHKTNTEQSNESTSIHRKTLKFHLGFLAAGGFLSAILATYLNQNQLSISPLLDASVTVFSVMTTYLMVKKVLENWLYWIVIDSAAIMLYWQNGYYPTVIMFLVYLGLALYGFFEWQTRLKNQPAKR